MSSRLKTGHVQKWLVHFVSGSLLALSQVALANDPLESSTSQPTADEFQQALDELANEDTQNALDIWQSLAKRYPHNLAVQNNLAGLLMKTHQYEQAQVLLEQALKHDAQIAPLWNNLNQLYAYQAQKTYQKVFEKTDVVAPKSEWAGVTAKDNLSAAETTKVAWMNAQQQVLNALENWRVAWTNQSVSEYLAAYQDQYFPEGFDSRAVWVENRRLSLGSPKFIKVSLSDVVALPLSDALVRVTFQQHYQSNRFQDVVTKALFFAPQQNVDGAKWQIVEEQVLNEK